MVRTRRSPPPDPWAASDQAEFRALLRRLQQWAGYSSLEQLGEGATRRGTSMPPSTANRALNNDKLPTADFVRRFVMACDADVAQWAVARDSLHDLKYSRDTTGTGPVEHSVPGVQSLSDPPDFCPYPGLAAFRPDQAQWFFGREEITAELLCLLTDRMVGTGPLVVVGPSGTGKSSLLRAGLLAALSEGRLPGSRNFAQLVFTPTANPLDAVGAPLAAATGTDRQEITAALSADPERVVEIIRKLPGAGEPHSSRAVIVVDQFEEVFTLCPDEPCRQAFIRVLCAAAAAGGGALVVLGLRADHYGRCAAYPELIGALRAGHLLLGAMTNKQLRSAIEKPALAAGLELEPGLVEIMVRDLGQGSAEGGESGYQPGALPLLSHALLATWQQREGRTLTLAGYRLVGGISGAVAKTAERAYTMLAPGQREIARSVLLRMIHLGEGVDDTRRRIERARLVAESTDPVGADKVLNALIEARLVTTDDTTVEIVHEILLSTWPRLQQWINADREDLLLQQRLIQAAEAWDRDGRHESDLYRGHRLAALSGRLAAADSPFPGLVTQFLRAAVDRERTDARRARLRKLTAVLSALVVMAAATATAFAIQSGQSQLDSAVQLGKEALSTSASGEAIRLRTSDRVLAAQLAVAAHHLSDTPEARGAVLSTLANLDLPHRTYADGQISVDAVAFSASGRLLVAAGQKTRIWRLGTQPNLNDPPIILPNPGEVRSAVFSRDDRLLATSSTDDVVRLWPVDDALHGKAQPTVIKHIVAGSMVFTPDNRLLAAGSPARGAIQLWDLTSGEPRLVCNIQLAHESEVAAVAISSDGRYVASAGNDGVTKLWDVSKPGSPTVMPLVGQDPDSVNAVAFSPDDGVLATANSDTTAKLFDISDPGIPRERLPLSGHQRPVSGVTFSRDGRTLLTTSDDTTARLWSLSDPDHPRLLATPLTGSNETFRSAVFSPDLHTIATAQGNSVRLWETDVNSAVTEICETVTSSLGRDQWNHYFPGQAYEQTCPQNAELEFRISVARPPVGAISLRASNSGKCVAIKDDGALIGAPAHQIDCTGALDEVWKLSDETVIPPGKAGDRLVKIVNAASGLCLESADAERKIRDATQVVQRPCVPGNDAQLWILDVLARQEGSVDVRFLGLKSHDCLNINGEATVNGAYVVRWPCHEPVPHKNEIFQIHGRY